MKCARAFTFESELASRQVEKVLDEVPETSMAMLGQTVYALTNKPEGLKETLEGYAKKVMVSKFNRWPAKVLK